MIRAMIVACLVIVLACTGALALTMEEARKAIADRGVDFTPEAFIDSAKNGRINLVELFVTAGMDPNVEADGTRAIAEASCGEIEVVRVLINAGANVNVLKDNGDSPLGEAANVESPEIVRLLLDSGADPDLGDPLTVAKSRGNKEIIKMLIDAGAKDK